MKVFTEAAGSVTWPALGRALREAGFTVVATDIDPLSIGFYQAGQGFLVPSGFGENFFAAAEKLLTREGITLVLPSLNEGLLEWAKRIKALAARGVTVLISSPDVIAMFVDKWRTYECFRALDIPTPDTALDLRYDLVKPRLGRGGTGVRRVSSSQPVEMTGMISQRYIAGREFTVDVLCDLNGMPIYIVPRERLLVESGISVRGRTVADAEIEGFVRRLCAQVSFCGPINLQCIRGTDGIYFTEVNPRISGGIALTLAATTNWFKLLRRLLSGESVMPGPIRYGLTMIRYYAEAFIDEEALAHADPRCTL